MIYASVKVTIKNHKASIDNKIILYRGDKNVEVQFEIVESLYRQYKLEGSNTIENLGASYGQLVVLKPDMSHVVSDIAPTKNGKVVFTIPESLIDESTELGSFTFQIRLYDESQSSRVTLPPVEEGLVVEEPLDLKIIVPPIVPPEEDVEDAPTESEGTIEINKRYIRTDTSSSTHILEVILTGSLLGKTVTWISSDTDVAEVSLYTSTACYVIVKNPGECIISARCGEHFDDCLIIVDELITDIPCTSVSIGQTKYIFSLIGQQVALNSTIKPLNTTDIIYWTSSNTSVATVSNGIVTSVGNGECTITVQCGNYSDTCLISVEVEDEPKDEPGDEPEIDNIPCELVTLSTTSYSFTEIGDRVTITANVLPLNTTDPIYWSSTNNSIATVSNGVVTSVGKGECIITVQCGNYSDTCLISVGENTDNIPCTSISLNKSSISFSSINSTYTLIATASPNNTTDTITWTTSNESVAIVNNGVVTAKSNGNCIITAICGNESASCNVFINVTSGGSTTEKIPCTGVTITNKMISVNTLGTKIQINATLSPSNTTDKISWSAFDKTVAIVDNNGLVTAIGNGETMIYAYCGNYSDYATITVNDLSVNDTLTDFIIDIEDTAGYIDNTHTGLITLTEKKYNRATIYPIPGSLLNSFTAQWSNHLNPEIVGLGSSSGTSMTLYPGRNGEATLTVAVSTNNGGYLRKKYKVITALEDKTENVEILYNNPTITMEGVRAKAEQNGIVQYFDTSCEPNTGHPSYNSYLTLQSSEGRTHYLALLNKGTSRFGKNGLHLDSGGWYTTASQTSGVEYGMMTSVLPWYNFNMSFTVKNENFNSALLERALGYFNQAFPALNVTVDVSSSNIIRVDNDAIESAFVGYNQRNSGTRTFEIVIFKCKEQEGRVMEADNDYFTAVTVHEFGHCFGTDDNASHKPSIFDYNSDISKCLWLQPNDIAWIEYMHKTAYGVDLTTNQEDIDAQVANMYIDTSEFKDCISFMYHTYDNIYDAADVVVDCELEYIDTQKINISTTGEMYFEYDIYNIVNETVNKGALESVQIKIPHKNVSIDENIRYRLYLEQYGSHMPSDLINPYQGIEIIK